MVAIGTQAKVKHPFRVTQQQFGFAKVHYRGASEKHGATQDLVCAIKPVDGETQADGAVDKLVNEFFGYGGSAWAAAAFLAQTTR